MGRTYRRNDIDKGIILFFPHRHGGEGFGQTQFAVFAVDNLHHIRDVLSIEGDGYLGAFDGSGNRFFGVTDTLFSPSFTSFTAATRQRESIRFLSPRTPASIV